MRRVLLFVGTNLLVMITIGLVLGLTGLYRYTTPYGLDLPMLMVFSLVVGFVGSGISLLASKWMAKTFMGVRVIDPNNPGDQSSAWLVQTVYENARKAGLEKMPEVGVFESPEMNAFATGPGRNNSLVAVSTGLFQHMDRDAISAVVGHEIAHVANGDMVTMALLQGIINTFVIFFARVIASFIGGSRDRGGFAYFITVMVLQIVFSILGSLVVLAFSRWREYRADAGGAQYAGRENMIKALQTLKLNEKIRAPKASPAMATMEIYGRGAIMNLFRSHPELDARIARLQEAR